MDSNTDKHANLQLSGSAGGTPCPLAYAGVGVRSARKARKWPWITGIVFALLVLAATDPGTFFVVGILNPIGNHPITVHGRVVDQDGHGVRGAIVAATINRISGIPWDSTKDWQTDVKTDVNGNFTIWSWSACDLQVDNVTVPDYVWDRESTVRVSFFRGSAVGSPANPILFHMRRRPPFGQF